MFPWRETRYVPFGNSIFARFAGNRYEWPCSLFFPSFLSRHIEAKMKADAPNPAIRIGRKQIKSHRFMTVLLPMCFYPKRAVKRHISSGTKGRISSGRKPTYRARQSLAYRHKYIAGTRTIFPLSQSRRIARRRCRPYRMCLQAPAPAVPINLSTKAGILQEIFPMSPKDLTNFPKHAILEKGGNHLSPALPD